MMTLIRNETLDGDGVCLSADVIDLATNSYKREVMGKVESTRPLTDDEAAMYAAAYSAPAPSDAELLAQARDALGPLDELVAPYLAADIVDVLIDVKTALGG